MELREDLSRETSLDTQDKYEQMIMITKELKESQKNIENKLEILTTQVELILKNVKFD